MIYKGICNFSYLIRSNYSFKNKVRILLVWFKVNLKSAFPFKTENILGFKINAFHYKKIRFLFDEIFYKGIYYFKTDNKRPIIFDCGANIGIATIYFKWLYPDSEIYAFEPDKETFKILEQNVEHINGVYIFNKALSDIEGDIDFYINCPGSLVMSTKKDRKLKNKVTVSSIRLSSLITKQVDFIKMDIEGSEKEVIQDLDENNKLKKINKLAIEYHHRFGKEKSSLSEILKIFEKNNFEYQINTKYTPSLDNKFQNIMIYLTLINK